MKLQNQKQLKKRGQKMKNVLIMVKKGSNNYEPMAIGSFEDAVKYAFKTKKVVKTVAL